MIYREVLESEKEKYNQVVSHPLQSFEWGDFRKKLGIKVIRVGRFEGKDITAGFQFTIHRLPRVSATVGYFPKGGLLDDQAIETLLSLGRQEKCIFVKIEPSVEKEPAEKWLEKHLNSQSLDLRPAVRPLFTKYTFQIDLQKSEDELLKSLSSKTRYNIRLAGRKGVEIINDDSKESFGEYLKLVEETTQRQQYYAHNQSYHRLMWQTLQPAGIAHLLKAVYRGETLASWIVFTFNGVGYYPYGASTRKYKELMASNLLMWEAIKFAKTKDCHTFDMWGSLGPNPDEKDPWYGFHRFKAGYGGRLVEFAGSYDLVLQSRLYGLYNLVDKLRWKMLRAKAKFSGMVKRN